MSRKLVAIVTSSLFLLGGAMTAHVDPVHARPAQAHGYLSVLANSKCRDADDCCRKGDLDECCHKGEDPHHRECCPEPYKKGKCERVPDGDNGGSGDFSLSVPGTSVTLIGSGNAGTAGTSVFVATVQAPHPLAHGQAFKVVTNGRIPPLRMAAKGRLYRLEISMGKWRAINAITVAGIYEAVRT
ncbi:MAG: hypothetical protein ACR2JC_05560 [Chloroflexota bacterium]